MREEARRRWYVAVVALIAAVMGVLYSVVTRTASSVPPRPESMTSDRVRSIDVLSSPVIVPQREIQIESEGVNRSVTVRVMDENAQPIDNAELVLIRKDVSIQSDSRARVLTSNVCLVQWSPEKRPPDCFVAAPGYFPAYIASHDGRWKNDLIEVRLDVTARIGVRVIDCSDGMPIPGATVARRDSSVVQKLLQHQELAETLGARARTDGDGSCYLSAPRKAGKIRIRAQAVGYFENPFTEVSVADSPEVRLELAPIAVAGFAVETGSVELDVERVAYIGTTHKGSSPLKPRIPPTDEAELAEVLADLESRVEARGVVWQFAAVRPGSYRNELPFPAASYRFQLFPNSEVHTGELQFVRVRDVTRDSVVRLNLTAEVSASVGKLLAVIPGVKSVAELPKGSWCIRSLDKPDYVVGPGAPQVDARGAHYEVMLGRGRYRIEPGLSLLQTAPIRRLEFAVAPGETLEKELEWDRSSLGSVRVQVLTASGLIDESEWTLTVERGHAGMSMFSIVGQTTMSMPIGECVFKLWDGELLAGRASVTIKPEQSSDVTFRLSDDGS